MDESAAWPEPNHNEASRGVAEGSEGSPSPSNAISGQFSNASMTEEKAGEQQQPQGSAASRPPEVPGGELGTSSEGIAAPPALEVAEENHDNAATAAATSSSGGVASAASVEDALASGTAQGQTVADEGSATLGAEGEEDVEGEPPSDEDAVPKALASSSVGQPTQRNRTVEDMSVEEIEAYLKLKKHQSTRKDSADLVPAGTTVTRDIAAAARTVRQAASAPAANGPESESIDSTQQPAETHKIKEVSGEQDLRAEPEEMPVPNGQREGDMNGQCKPTPKPSSPVALPTPLQEPLPPVTHSKPLQEEDDLEEEENAQGQLTEAEGAKKKQTPHQQIMGEAKKQASQEDAQLIQEDRSQSFDQCNGEVNNQQDGEVEQTDGLTQEVVPPDAPPQQQREPVREAKGGQSIQRPQKEAGEMKREQMLRSKRNEVERLRREADALKRAQRTELTQQQPKQEDLAGGLAEEMFPTPLTPPSFEHSPGQSTPTTWRRKGCEQPKQKDQARELDEELQATVPLICPSEYSPPQPASTVLSPTESSMAKRRKAGPNFDIESQSTASSRSSTPPARASEQRSNGRAPQGAAIPSRKGSRHSGWLIILRKIVRAIVTDLDDDALRRNDVEPIFIVIALLKEAILGIVIAFALMSVLLFLDHRFLLGLPLARNYRRAAFHLMNDEDVLETFENDTDLKFMDWSEYQELVDELERATNSTRAAEPIFQQRAKDLEEAKAEREKAEPLHQQLFESLDLDKFCSTCMWNKNNRISCGRRVNALEETYNTPKYTAIMSAMQKKSCWKSPEQLAKDREMRKEEDALLKEWSKGNDFCSDCEWQGDTSCAYRAVYLQERFALSTDRSQARVMLQHEQCRVTTKKKEDEALARFCYECKWNNKLTCQQRVDYLMYTYKNTERKATFSALETPSCVRNSDG